MKTSRLKHWMFVQSLNATEIRDLCCLFSVWCAMGSVSSMYAVLCFIVHKTWIVNV